ncbi:hypothetical protein PoB_001627200 [Plakobranchus ocellatus]|uniref:Uncharacterized protein n=1 Tax=Plakobranchus ocellatus TaxID=259542 RepID=A0AAV3Z5D8_9GAST|nr:hypothetical protein PoB_001627200 [Plakobranchus ocellatus]
MQTYCCIDSVLGLSCLFDVSQNALWMKRTTIRSDDGLVAIVVWLVVTQHRQLFGASDQDLKLFDTSDQSREMHRTSKTSGADSHSFVPPTVRVQTIFRR